MSNDRLDQLRSLLADEPEDKFLRHAMAMEHKRNGDMEQAARMLEALIREEPKYIPPYYQLALILAELDRPTDAMEVCRAGALQCVVTGDRKARKELLALGTQLASA